MTFPNAIQDKDHVVVNQPSDTNDTYDVEPETDVTRSSIILLLAEREEEDIRIGADASRGETLRPAGPTPITKARSDDED